MTNPAPHTALNGFHEATRLWFASSFEAPTRPQVMGWPVIQTGQSTLILAPTGTGKTLTAFMVAIDRLMFAPVPPKMERCRVLYVSPLKALAIDIERNLRAPLVGVARMADRLEAPFNPPTVMVRTGDTPQRDRAAFLRAPADILVTTPESLYLMLTSNARDTLRNLQWVVLDEVHAMVSSKRGAHLALSLERLEELTSTPLQRIGLSATIRPLDEVARFMGGFTETLAPDKGRLARPVQVVDAGGGKTLLLSVETPVEDMAAIGESPQIPSGPAAQGLARTSIWPSMHPLLLELIRAHRTTLIFVNSRRLAERLATALNDLAGELIAHAHHGSVAREQRMLIEEELKSGRLPAMVATSTLELGIDMGSVDLVVQVESPPSIASGLQRIGRAGHHIGAPSTGIIIPKYRGDLPACAALTERMLNGQVENLKYPRNPLDVLAQQIVAMVSLDDWTVERLAAVVRRAAPFAELTDGMLREVLDMLSGRYPSDDFAELRPRITWDRIADTLHAREGARRVAVTNGGTIPDRGLYGVFMVGEGGKQGRVGELDEEMVFECRVGEVFLLGASSWRIEEITHDRVIVSPAPGIPGKTPFWKGDSPGRPLEFGRAIGKLCRTLCTLEPAEANTLLVKQHCLTPTAATNLLQYLTDQNEAIGAIPDDKTIVIESYMDEMGDWRVCILSPFGSRVLAPWALAMGGLVRQKSELDVDIFWTDDGIVARFPEMDQPPPLDWLIPDADDVEDLVVTQLGAGSEHSANQPALFAARFREAAGRALLLPKRNPGRRAPLWQTRKRASDLLRATARFGSFPIILEAFRECLQDTFDMPALQQLLTEIQSRTVRIVPITSRIPSPFASSLMFNYLANFVYEYDTPLAERRAQALTVDSSQLRELLGEVDLRQLLDADALEQLELHLQALTPERAAHHMDGLHDLFIRLGDLSLEEVRERCRSREDAATWVVELEMKRRIARITIASEARYIAVEDSGRFRDALGAPPAPGLPMAFLEYTPNALRDIMLRYARTHGPFTTVQVAQRLGLGIGPVNTELRSLQREGRVIEGELRPGGTGLEWCDTEVLRALRQKSLARLRREVEPVEQPALARFYLAWHGIEGPLNEPTALKRRGSRLLEAIELLQGAPLPASMLESRILPARVDNYEPRELDALCASGELIWVGLEPLGQHDGRIALYRTEHAALLMPERNAPQFTVLQGRIYEHLDQRGAQFFGQMVQQLGGFPTEILDAIWELVWEGVITNDTLAPLRAVIKPQREQRRVEQYSVRHSSAYCLRTGLSGAGRSVPPAAAGRWSLVRQMATGEPSRAERMAAHVGQMLDRYGVLTREAVQAEGVTGGFTAIYGALKTLEETGRIRRGYFVSGLGATQFAVPAALERLRTVREPSDDCPGALLAATDPANPYGAALPWPERTEGRRPMRMAGALVAMVDGKLAGWIGRGEKQLTTFLDLYGDEERDAMGRALALLLAADVGPGRRRGLTIAEVDGKNADESPMAAPFLAAGFIRSGSGFVKR